MQRYAPELNRRCRPELRTTNRSWRVDETYLRVAGKWTYLYRAVDSTGATKIVTTVIPDYLYQIDPLTGKTTRGAPTLPALSATVDVNGTFYAFKADTSELLTLDLTNGNTRVVTDIKSAGLILGAAPAVPEPASIVIGN